MSVVLTNNAIAIIGNCGVEDAETLLALCQGNPGAPVNLSAAGAVHTALWQVLMVVSSPVAGVPADPFARRWIMPMLTRPNPLSQRLNLPWTRHPHRDDAKVRRINQMSEFS